MIFFPNAKINLGLDIIEKRSDGYHNIESCFYPIPYYDVVEILPAKDFSIHTTGISIKYKEEEKNICQQAFENLKKEYQIENIMLHLHKAIPIGAGLGGGSSDAAYTIKGLNSIFSLTLNDTDMESMAAKLGSDCAFFIQNKPRFCFGKGNEFEELNISLVKKHLLLIYPNLFISTQEAYQGIKPERKDLAIKDVLKMPIVDWKNYLQNDFEKSLFSKYAVLKDLKEKLYRMGALYASMSGSGSSIYGIFEQPIDTTSYNFPKEFTIWQGQLN